MGRSDGHGFAVVAADLNGDGKTDLYVANDRDPHFLYLNNGDGTFRDVSEESGAGYDVAGRTQAGMGVDAEDVDGDGLPELFVTHFANDYNTLYRNLGRDTFLDATANFGLAVDSLPWIGWGCALADLDNDGWPDCVVANADVDDNVEFRGQPVSDRQPPLLHLNLAGRRFRLANRGAGTYFESRHLGHGLALGDLDDDGDLDLVFSHKDGPPSILRNDTQTRNHWIRLACRGTRSSRDGIGAQVEVHAGGRVIHRLSKSGHSLMSSHDPRILVGVGTAESVERVLVRWPSGEITTLEHPALSARPSRRDREKAMRPSERPLLSGFSALGLFAAACSACVRDDPQDLAYRAQAEAAAGRPAEAEAALAAAGPNQAADGFRATASLASREQSRQDRRGAAALDGANVPTRGPEAAAIAARRGELEMERHHFRAAEAELKRGLVLNPKSIDARRRLIWLYAAAGPVGSAGRRIAGAGLGLEFRVSGSGGLDARPARAIDLADLADALVRVLAEDPDDRLSRLALAESLRRLGRLDQADATLAALVRRARRSRLPARIALDRGDTAAAEALLGSDAGDDSHAARAELRGRLALGRGDAAAAVNHFRAAARGRPGRP